MEYLLAIITFVPLLGVLLLLLIPPAVGPMYISTA